MISQPKISTLSAATFYKHLWQLNILTDVEALGKPDKVAVSQMCSYSTGQYKMEFQFFEVDIFLVTVCAQNQKSVHWLNEKTNNTKSMRSRCHSLSLFLFLLEPFMCVADATAPSCTSLSHNSSLALLFSLSAHKKMALVFSPATLLFLWF